MSKKIRSYARGFLITAGAVMLILSCAEGAQLDDPTLPNIYASLYRESSDPSNIYARNIRLTTQGPYDPETDHGIYGATVSVDGVACGPSVSPAYQYYSGTPIATSPAAPHVLSAVIGGVAYTATIAAPGNFSASCNAAYKKTDNIGISYAFTANLASDALKATVYSNDSQDGKDHVIDIVPSVTGSVTIPAGILAPGTDRYIQITISNTVPVEAASKRSFLSIIQTDGLYVDITN